MRQARDGLDHLAIRQRHDELVARTEQPYLHPQAVDIHDLDRLRGKSRLIQRQRQIRCAAVAVGDLKLDNHAASLGGHRFALRGFWPLQYRGPGEQHRGDQPDDEYRRWQQNRFGHGRGEAWMQDRRKAAAEL